MEIKTVYSAFDGTCFENYNDCKEYELKVLGARVKNDFFIFDFDRRPLSYDDIEDACYMICKTQEAVSFAQQLSEFHCRVSPWDDAGFGNISRADDAYPGFFYWDSETETWNDYMKARNFFMSWIHNLDALFKVTAES